MTFYLRTISQSPCRNLWHELLAAGRLVNGKIEVPDAAAQVLLSRCAEAPPAAEPLAPVVFAARQRSEAEKAPLRALCAVCEFNQDGQCLGSTCCGGRVPVEVKLNLSTTRCPKSKWPPENEGGLMEII